MPNTIETSVAKYYATESAVECANLAIQVHGGAGYVDDYPVERYLRDARVTTLYEGTSQIQKLIIGRAATGINAMLPLARKTGLSRGARFVETSLDEHVALLRLNRPEARNALSPEVMEEIAGALERLDPDPEVRCIVIAGTEKVFAAGADIKAMSGAHSSGGPLPPRGGVLAAVAAVEDADDRRRLGLGARRGMRAGPGLRHDRRLGEREFGQPEINLGIIPGGGGTQRLARVLGKQRAMECVLTGTRFDAETAERWGLVNRVAKAGAYVEEAMELARAVAEKAADRDPPREAGGPGRRGDRALRGPRERAAYVRDCDGDRG